MSLSLDEVAEKIGGEAAAKDSSIKNRVWHDDEKQNWNTRRKQQDSDLLLRAEEKFGIFEFEEE